MAHEVDFIAVGEGEKAGDAITLRFGNLAGPRDEQVVVVIDGGFSDTGDKTVQHIGQYYGTDTVDLVISTHPDADHIGGLYSVLEQMHVGTLLMHQPWNHAEDIRGLFEGNRSSFQVEKSLEKSIFNAKDLERLAEKKGVNVIEPFQGTTGFGGAMHILGPSEEYYQWLLPLFRATPDPIAALQRILPTGGVIQKAMQWIQDHSLLDLLNDDKDTTSAENNTSTIILFNLDGRRLLFTGDAGKTALHYAADYADSQGISLAGLNFLDVPHHGSKRNLSTSILKRINGTPAFVSAPKDSPKHPSKKVTNALQKHGATVHITRGKGLRHGHLAPDRFGWVPAPIEPFHDYFEE